MKKHKVLLLGGGRMGQIARDILERIEEVDLFKSEGQVLEEGMFDFIFSASWPSRIPQEWCKLAKIGSVNIHTSLLPEGRGSHPLNWALIWDRPKTGVTIHKIVDTYDAGDICLQQEVPIFETDNIVCLRDRVEDAFRIAIVEFFKDPVVYFERAWQQNQCHASYAQKRLPMDCELNMKASPKDIWNLFRACHPQDYPAYFFDEQGKKWIVREMKYEDGEIFYTKSDVY